jgi:sulfotransferase family protein
MNIKVLDFVVIGVHKSGTTALFQYLRHHPQVYIPPEKEVGFFSNEDWFSRGWEPFVQEFFARAPKDVLWGKVTPQYMAYSHVPERLFRKMPNVKLIALLRNPVDRAFSHYRMAVRIGGEKRAFDEVISSQLEKPDFISMLTLGEYGRILRLFLRYFPPEQLLVLFTEELEKHPQVVLDSILTHIGLEPGFSPSNLGEPYHKGGTRQRFRWLIPAARRAPPIWWIWKALPENRKRVIRFWFQTQINTIPESAPPLEMDLRWKLIEFYQADVLDLEGLIGKEVPWEEFHKTSRTDS